MNKTAIVLTKRVASKIVIARNLKVILDEDLAELYRVPVRHLNQQVKRNSGRFPEDFAFQLTESEDRSLRSQNGISKSGRGGRRYLPHAFTEHGAIMAASVLKSKRAIEMSVFVVRAFVEMREALAMNQRIEAKLLELETRLDGQGEEIEELLEAIRELTAPLPASGRRIGFEVPPASDKSQGKVVKVTKAKLGT